MNRDQILAALPRLKKPDLLAIRAVTNKLLGEAATPTAPKGENAPAGLLGLLYDGLLNATGLHLGYAQFSRSNAGKQFKRYGQVVVTFAEENFPEAMAKRVSALAIFRLLLELIIADLKARKVPVSLGTITLNMERVHEVFSAAFPGYLEAGLGNLIASQMRRQ